MLKTRSAKFQILKAALLMAVWTMLGTGCAKISEPQPPEVRIPKPAIDLAARQVSDFVVLTVSKPAQNTDGSASTTLKSIELFRLAEDTRGSLVTSPLPEEQFLKQAAPILLIPLARFSSYLQGESFVIQDKLPSSQASEVYAHAFRYAVRFINNKNQTAGLSNRAIIAPIPIPLPPEGLSAQVTETSIKLKWVAPSENMDGSKPPRIAGYNVYKSEQAEKLSPDPINHDPVPGPEFEDRDFQFDKTYYYAVSTVGSRRNPRAESLPSKACSVTARDVFPPAPPADFNAVFGGGIVILLWSPSSSTDVAGYRLYRQERGAAARQALQSELITVFSYRDTSVVSGKRYEYSIQAVDTHGNESAMVQTEVETGALK